MSYYPTSIPNTTNYPDRADDVDWIYAVRYNEIKNEVIALCAELGISPSGGSATVLARLATLALKSNVLELDNVGAFTPDADYEPATKKYVDDNVGAGDVTAAANIGDHKIVRGDGGAKGIQESAALISDGGEMTNASQPSFSVYLSEDQSNIAVGDYRTVLFDLERFDQGADFNITSHIFTAPVSGRYQFTLNFLLQEIDSACGYLAILIKTSNHTYFKYIYPPQRYVADSSDSLSSEVLADMDANDTCEIQIICLDGASQTDINAGHTWFTGFLAH